MPRFERILAYDLLDDDSHLAVDHAAGLARRDGAALTVVRVLPVGSRLLPWRGAKEERERVLAFLESSQRQLLEEHVAPLREEGLRVDVDVRWGTPWLEVVHCVMRDGFDLVVKAAEGARRSSGLFFGSTALHLIRKCPCPVWIVGSAPGADPPRVLAAVDPTEDEVHAAIARHILELGASVAGEAGELHAVSVWRALGEHLLRSRVSPEELADYVREARDGARAGLERALGGTGSFVPEERVHLIKGDPEVVLPAFVEKHEFDLVVMGSLGRLGIAGLLIGETAETLIRSVRCSVLVVKPPGFVSPVTLPAESVVEESRVA